MELNKKEINYIIKYFRDIIYLIFSQLIWIRTGWVWYFILGTVFPCITLSFMFLFLKDQMELALYVVSGNAVFSLSMGSMNLLGQQLAYMKDTNSFDYYATLPISKTNLIFAIATRSTLFTFPSVIIILFIGKFLFNIDINFNIMIIPVLLIGGYSLSGFGAIIGFYSPSMQIANVLTQLLSLVMIFGGPVMIPENKLPLFMRYISKCFPTTYVAATFRSAIKCIYDMNFMINFAIVCSITFISLFLVVRKLDWSVN